MNGHVWRARAGLSAGAMAWCLATLLLARAVLDVRDDLAAGTLSPDAALAALAGLLGLPLLGWVAVVTACAVGTALLPARSRAGLRARRWGERITPAHLRRLLALTVGAALALPGPVALAAVAPPAGGRDRPPVLAAGLDPAWAPGPPAAPGGRPSPRASPRPERSAPSGRVPVTAHRGLPTLDPSWGSPARLRPGIRPDGALVVRRGDTLWDLAARHLGPSATDAQIAAAWPHWFTANRDVIGPDPDLLLPGQRLTPPPPPSGDAA